MKWTKTRMTTTTMMNRAFLPRCLRFQNDSRRTEDDRLSFPFVLCVVHPFMKLCISPSEFGTRAHALFCMHCFAFCISPPLHDSLLDNTQYTPYTSALRSHPGIGA